VPELVSRGLASDTGTDKTVAGRSCRVYRFYEPPVGPIKPLSTGSARTSSDDLCIDSDGLILSEAWSLDGKLAERRTATQVRLSATVPSVATATEVSGSIPAARVQPDADPSSFIAPPPVPSGFRPSGQAVDFTLPDPQQPKQLAAVSVVWAYVKGPAVITVEAGREEGGQLPWQAGDTVARPVTLKGLGPATTAVRSDGGEVRIDLGSGNWVRVRGNVPVDSLVNYANQLRPL
ncbi:MAG TPA: hypothetical protein VFH45_02140, partial [Acidimicrobiales bacterium]|nr:hypothetical protein [Acidimicrobiales bacterium]